LRVESWKLSEHDLLDLRIGRRPCFYLWVVSQKF